MLRSAVMLTICLFINSSLVSAKNYYIKNGGNNRADGKSEATAWASISKVNGMHFLPGDSILFKKGDVWRETLIVPSSGNADHYLYFGSYGPTTSPKPKILGSKQAIKWTNQGGNIWKSETSVATPYKSSKEAEIFFEQQDGTVKWGVHKDHKSSLIAEYQWTWLANYIYIYSDIDPNVKYVSVEVPQRERGIFIDNKEYITIDGFEIKFCRLRSIDTEYPQQNTTGLTIKNCHISYVGSRIKESGFHLSVCRNNLLIQNNEVHDGGRRNTSVHIYGAQGITISGITFDGNILHDGYHSSGIGLVLDGWEKNNRFENIIIRNNLIYDNPERNPSVDGFSVSEMGSIRASILGGGLNPSISNVEIYNNIWKNTTAQCLMLENVDDVKIYNNTFYDFNHNIPKPAYLTHIQIQTGCTDIDIKNNIFYGELVFGKNYRGENIYLAYDQDPSEVSVDYNLFYQADINQLAIGIGSTNKDYRTTPSSWSTMKTDLGWQTHEPGHVNPLFILNSYYHLLAESPAIGSGINVGLETDFDGNEYNKDNPSIGAFEGNPPKYSEKTKRTMTVFSNLAQRSSNTLINKSNLELQTIRIYTLSGKLVFTDTLELVISNVQFPSNLKSGIYNIVTVSSGKQTQATQKLIVIRKKYLLIDPKVLLIFILLSIIF